MSVDVNNCIKTNNKKPSICTNQENFHVAKQKTGLTIMTQILVSSMLIIEINFYQILTVL